MDQQGLSLSTMLARWTFCLISHLNGQDGRRQLLRQAKEKKPTENLCRHKNFQSDLLW